MKSTDNGQSWNEKFMTFIAKNLTTSLSFLGGAGTVVAGLLFIPNTFLSLSSDTTEGNKINLNELSKVLAPAIDSTQAFNDKVTEGTIIIPNNKIPQTRDDLGSMRTVVKIYNGSQNEDLTIPGFGGIKLAKKENNLNVYYIETKVVNNSTDSIVYGIGYSVHYLFKKIKNGLDLSNLPSIAASVQIENKKTQVYYSLQTYGVKGINLVRYFKPTVNKNFDVEGFSIMQSSIDGIQNILGDSTLSKSVKFTPEILKFVKPYDLN